MSAIVLVVIAVLLGALFQFVVGFGSMLVAAPVLFLVLPPEQAVLTALVLGLFLNAFVIVESRMPPPRESWLVLGVSVPMMALGALAATRLPESVLLAMVGVMSLAMGLHRLLVAAPDTEAPVVRRSTRSGLVAGITSGFFNTSIGVNGPPLAHWLSGRPPKQFRADFASMSLVQGVIGCALLIPLVRASDATKVAGTLPFLALAVVIAYLVSTRITIAADRHHRLVAITIAVTGLSAIVKAFF